MSWRPGVAQRYAGAVEPVTPVLPAPAVSSCARPPNGVVVVADVVVVGVPVFDVGVVDVAVDVVVGELEVVAVPLTPAPDSGPPLIPSAP